MPSPAGAHGQVETVRGIDVALPDRHQRCIDSDSSGSVEGRLDALPANFTAPSLG